MRAEYLRSGKWGSAARALALAAICGWTLGGTAAAESGRGGGYQTAMRHRHLFIETEVRRLDELLNLSAAQKSQIKRILERRPPSDAAAVARIRALLTERQRRIYDQPR